MRIVKQEIRNPNFAIHLGRQRGFIYLNGAILEMKKAEIDRKFEEIVAFAEEEGS